MRSRIDILIIYVVMGLLLSSCQSTNRAGLDSSKPLKVREPLLSKTEENILRKKVNDWNGLRIDSSNLSPDTFLKMTENYLQAKEMLHKNEVEYYEEALNFYEKGQISTKPQFPVQDYKLLIKRLNTLKDRFQYSKKTDAIYYLLGYALYEQDNRDEGIKVFEEFVKKYPQSDYWIEVNFRLGEFFFETGQMAEAIEAYGRILNFPQSVFHDKALYKLGWTYYKLNDFKKAIDTFWLIAEGKEGRHGESGLKEESLSCVALSMSRFSDMNQAVEYLKSKEAKDHNHVILTKLADSFFEEGRYESALPVLKQLAESSPDPLARPFIYEKISLVYDRTGKEEEAAKLRRELVDKHSPDTEWHKKNCTEDKCEKVDELVSNTALNTLKSRHVKEKNKDNLDLLGDAIKGYRQLAANYPKSQNLKEINLLLAEALFGAKKYSDAVKEYENAARMYPEGADRAEIAYNAILTYEILFLKGESGSDKIMESMRQIITAYGADLAQSEKLDKAIFKVADMYVQKGLYSEARGIISPLLEGSNPVPAYHKTAELLIMEKNFVAAEEIYSRIALISAEPTIKEELAKVRYDVAEGHLKEGKYEEAAAMFDLAFKTSPKSRVGEVSLLKLGSVYIKTENINKIKGTVRLALETIPKSANTISLLVESGYVIAKEDPVEAARFYEDAIAIAFTLNKAGKPAIAIGKLILSTSELYENNKNYSKAEQLLIKYLEAGKPKVEEEAELLLKLANTQFMIKKKEKGIESLNRVARMEGSVNPELVAKARLMLAKEKQEKYLAIKLTQPFEKTLVEKTALFDDLIRDYTQIAKHKILQAEVFFQMGVAFENFRDSILQAERPSDLSRDELEEYKFLLEEKAYPYEEQAVKAYEKSLAVGRTLKTSQEWMESSIIRLAVIKPVLYKREFIKEKKLGSFVIEPEPVPLGSSL